jgi:amino-acid N-acetyltransferase
MEPYEIVPARAADWPRLTALLGESGLPLDGLKDHLASAILARDATTILGCAALELYDTDALLRSVAVAADHRGRGIGEALTAAAIALARQRGVRAIYLLTETAARFFPRFGFEETSRAAVPAAVKQSVEFTTVCAVSATVMVLPLRTGPA